MSLAFAGLAVASVAGAGGAGPTARPNVVLIVSDDAGYADFGFMNQFTGQTTKFKTPRLDQLAQQSVVFSNGYVAGSLCSSSRSGFLTGRYTQRFGAETNYLDTNNPIDGLPPGEVLLSERFKELGYATGAVGKWHLGMTEAHHPLNNGFDEFYGVLQGSRAYFDVPNQPPILRQNTPIDWAHDASDPSFNFNNIPNDPVNGRLLTDALGDEASRFIKSHAEANDPFFLYVPLNAPHYPNNLGKASDSQQFSGSGLTGDRYAIASLAYGLDRNVGEILDRLSDPNRDGNTSDSIRENTIVVFLNDNGGDKPLQPGNRQTYDNGPLYNYKGSFFEGGIRVPFMISAPGVDPGVVNQMVSSLDLFPTLVAAAGGAQTTPTDGVDLRPLLSGQQAGPVHEALFWRMELDGFAVRKGDWKLVKGTSNSPIELFRLNPNGSGEINPTDPNSRLDMSAQYPEKVLELTRDYVHWEATVDKLRYSGDINAFKLNQFDEFKQRNELTTAFNWQWGQGWRNANDPAVTGTLKRWDAAPNTVLIFETRNDANFTSVNNIVRAAGHSANVSTPTPAGLYEFMLNEVRLEGNFAGAANRSGTLSGNPLMFVKNLNGRHAQLSLNANKSSGPQNFTFNVNMDVILVDDLLATGNGTGAFAIGGVIRDFDAPRSLIKEGTSKLKLAGHNTFKGETIIRGGELSLESAAAAIDGSQHVIVQAGGALTLANGSIATNRLTVEPGGVFNFTGGSVQAAEVVGDLTNAGGVFDPSAAQGLVNIFGSYVQSAGALHIDIGLTEPGALNNDQLAVSGSVQLGGTLEVALASPYSISVGDVFPIVSAAGGVFGQFNSVTAPTLPTGFRWAIQYTIDSAALRVTDLPGSGGPLSFYSRWRQSFGIDGGGDWDSDGDSDGVDFLAWQRSGILGATAAATGVPEPSGLILSAGVLLLDLVFRRRNGHERRPS